MTPKTSAPSAALPPSRSPRPRRYLMCSPTHFAVEYAINPWMSTDGSVDRDLALSQWDALRRVYLELGHQVQLIDPVPGLPDMVFAANGGLVVDGAAMPARFRYAERVPEGPAYRNWLRDNGFTIRDSSVVNEGEGDFLVIGDRILAGTGFRTHPRAHDEAQELFGLPVITLQLVDPRFYHLDTALAVLDDQTVAYYPQAFTPGSQGVLRRMFPDAILAEAADAEVLGLNAVSDGLNVVLPAMAAGMSKALQENGFQTIPVDMSELLKAGGGPKCCTLELR